MKVMGWFKKEQRKTIEATENKNDNPNLTTNLYVLVGLPSHFLIICYENNETALKIYKWGTILKQCRT